MQGETKVNAYSSEGAQEQFRYGLDRFLEEARTLARFSDNPNIVAVRDYFEANGTGYLVMAYLDGITFKQHLAMNGNRIPYEDAFRILLPVMEALDNVHQVGLLHRDISPDNIYITRNNQVKILDFGAARYALGDRSKSLSIILKAGYAPEEQYRSKGVQGAWTDVYATAATLYRAITGIVPPEALDRGVEDSIVLPSRMGVNIPPAAETALMKALAVYAQHRFQTMREFKDVLVSITPITMAPGMVTGPSSYGVGLEKTQALGHGNQPATGPMLEKTAPAQAYAAFAGAAAPMYQPGTGSGGFPPNQGDVTAAGPSYASGYGQAPYPPQYGTSAPKKKKWPWIVAGVLLLFLAGVIAIVSMFVSITNTEEAVRLNHNLPEIGVAPDIKTNTTKGNVKIESITMCQSIDETTVKMVGPTTSFASSAGKMYAYITMSAPPSGDVIGNWYYKDPVEGYKLYNTYTVQGDGTSDVFYFWVSNSAFPKGSWEFEIVLNDGTYSTTAFTVI